MHGQLAHILFRANEAKCYRRALSRTSSRSDGTITSLCTRAVFEPFTLQFAQAAISALGLAAGRSVLDVGAGSGGAALAMAEQGLRVTAIDASPRMVDRILTRAERGLDRCASHGWQALNSGRKLRWRLSVLGIILFPDASAAWPRCAAWCVRRAGFGRDLDPAAELRAGCGAAAAIQAVWPEQPPAPLPAQLRYREEAISGRCSSCRPGEP